MPKEKSITYILIWQTAGRFILQGISFITAPLFTRLLSPSDYGQVAVYSAWVSLCTLITGLQTHGSIANAKIKYGDDNIDRYLSSIMTLSVISFMVMVSIGIAANTLLSRLLALRTDLVILLVIQSFASFCVAFYTTKFIQYKQAERSTLLSLIVSILSTGLSLVFLLFIAENRYIVKIYTNAIPIIIVGIIILFYVYLKGKKIIDRTYWKYCLSLTLPLILHGAGQMILIQSDRVMLQRMIGEGSAGIYSFAYTIALVITVIWGSFNTAWVPFYYDYKKNNATELILVRTKNYTIVFSIITMGFILLMPEVYKIMAPQDYWSGIRLAPLVSVASYFNFLYGFPANFEFYKGRTKLISIGTLCAAIINIICNFLLIPRYAEMGAAIATLVSYIFLFGFHEIIARFIIKEYENRFTIYVLGIIPVGITVLVFYLTQELWFIRWGMGLVLAVYLVRRVVKYRSVF
jgi:O-antigen/teichoic acid export membrane protein